jgi:hypothetical protein
MKAKSLLMWGGALAFWSFFLMVSLDGFLWKLG